MGFEVACSTKSLGAEVVVLAFGVADTEVGGSAGFVALCDADRADGFEITKRDAAMTTVSSDTFAQSFDRPINRSPSMMMARCRPPAVAAAAQRW